MGSIPLPGFPMTDQLNLINVAPPGPEDATTPGRHGQPQPAPPAGRPPIPERTSPTARLRGQCVECGQWPFVDELLGVLLNHKYPKRDLKARRGRCAAVGMAPERMKWSEPFK